MTTNRVTSYCIGVLFVDVQITDCGRSVFPMNADTDQMDEVTLNLYSHLCSLLGQRDFYIRVTVLSLSVTVTCFIISSFSCCLLVLFVS